MAINQNESDRVTTISEPRKDRSWLHAVWAAALAVALGANFYLYQRAQRLGSELNQVSSASRAHAMQLGDLTARMEEGRARLVSMGDEFFAANKNTTTALARARSEARLHNEKLSEEITSKFNEHGQKQQQVATELSDLKTVTDSKFSAVSSDVNGVKEEVASAKFEIEKTGADLRRVVGDMGVMSGLIATNAKELGDLRRLGERNYLEFTVNKKNPSRVGSVQIALKKVDQKRNRYTLEVLADDKKVEKKDRTINEPIQLYVAGGRLPYEIVVNEVKKDAIVGYLATPKLNMARR
jgi:hypothetical protein